jgi:hypothetical protein
LLDRVHDLACCLLRRRRAVPYFMTALQLAAETDYALTDPTSGQSRKRRRRVR